MSSLVEVSAHELVKTRLCKLAGCDEAADKATGPYAMLCRFHTEEARQARRTGQNGSGPVVTLPEQAGGVAEDEPQRPGDYESVARRLILLGRRVDVCKRAYDEAVAGWQGELERLRC